MTTTLDHIAIAVRDLDPAQAAYRLMLGVEPDRQDGDGAKRAWFRFPNMALELMAPDGEGGGGDRVRAQLEAQGEGVWSLAFTAPDLEACGVRLARLNLRNTIHVLHEMNAIPIINENDTISTDEIVRISFGDNDILAALVTHVLQAPAGAHDRCRWPARW